MFANIIVDISHEKLDKTFQYKIPDSLLSEIEPGVQVYIPFGSANRLIKGYVTQVTDIAEFDESRLKEVNSIVPGSLSIESRLIKLAAWIRQNYGGTMNQALKTVIPIKKKVNNKVHKTIKLKLGKEQAESELAKAAKSKSTTARARLLQELINLNQIDYDVVIGKLSISSSTIKAMERLDMIDVISTTLYRNPVQIENSTAYDIELNEEQSQVVDDIYTSDKRVHLIHGVTGSGKTEVYIELISKVISEGRQAIVLIPEIALTYQTVMRFYRKFGDKVSIINSRLSGGERFDQFERAKKGDIDIMIGPRSALFTPFEKLGLIIIDEEHEGAYKSENVPKYHARETAIKIAEMTDSKVVLGSATPSIEAYYQTGTGEYVLHRLLSRAKNAALPEVTVVDLREELKKGNKSIFSEKLDELIRDRLSKHQQIMIFINRRGYAGFVSCRACGKAMKCPHCDVSLTAHMSKGKVGYLKCHYCGYEIAMPDTCPECGSKYIATFGTGTQKVEEMIRKQYNSARVLRMDLDTTSTKDGHERILAAFANHEADILIGTQMIVKGHDFPNVTLVGVVAADLSLYASDYRATERTFELLTQAAGRAGRGTEAGNVIIQTYSPDNYGVITASNQDYESFYEQEIAYRSIMQYPPFANMLAILISSKNEKEGEIASNYLKDIICSNKSDKMMLIGPTEAAISKINDIYRKVIYLKEPDYAELVRIKNIIDGRIFYEECLKKVSIQFDFTPLGNY